ncbi:NAD(P)H-binding protein [Streptomyces iakyrus]|uniref:NAD(P)H-binding protein n=1 Tax=Streptomyces iakyrus TaxID=68219 RepID=UPI003D8DFEEE
MPPHVIPAKGDSTHGERVTGDLLKGEGVEAAVDGMETVLHLAGGPKGDDDATRTPVRAASRAGVRHLLHISVTGADRVPPPWPAPALARPYPGLRGRRGPMLPVRIPGLTPAGAQTGKRTWEEFLGERLGRAVSG